MQVAYILSLKRMVEIGAHRNRGPFWNHARYRRPIVFSTLHAYPIPFCPVLTDPMALPFSSGIHRAGVISASIDAVSCEVQIFEFEYAILLKSARSWTSKDLSRKRLRKRRARSFIKLLKYCYIHIMHCSDKFLTRVAQQILLMSYFTRRFLNIHVIGLRVSSTVNSCLPSTHWAFKSLVNIVLVDRWKLTYLTN